MSINGVLEDLALADVLQFVHLSRRTGTLYLWRQDERRAEIGFHDGRIVSAWSPGHRRLGDLLIAAGIINQQALDAALKLQQQEDGERILGQILLTEGVITRQDVHRVMKEQVQASIFDLLTWRFGSFHFEMDERRPIDDIGLVPGDVLDDLDLNTQMVLLEAARSFDEHPRKTEEAGPDEEAPDASDDDDGGSELDRRLRLAGLARSSAKTGSGSRPAPYQSTVAKPSSEPIRCQVVSQDRGLLTRLQQNLASDSARVVAVRPREAGTRVPGEATSPIVIFDLRQEDVGMEEISSLARTRPAASVVVVADTAEEIDAAYDAGASAVFLTADDQAITACCRNLVRVARHSKIHTGLGFGGEGGFTRFRRVVYDVRSGLLSATMALNLMHVISESVERAILFLVQGDELTAVGAFGFSAAGEGLAGLASGLKLRPDSRSVLRRVLDVAEPQSLDFDDAHLGDELEGLLGRPASGQVVIFPVLGAERTISIIYTDNGQSDEEIQDIKILDLATSQVGVAFEDELLRQKMAREGSTSLLG